MADKNERTRIRWDGALPARDSHSIQYPGPQKNPPLPLLKPTILL